MVIIWPFGAHVEAKFLGANTTPRRMLARHQYSDY